MVISAAYPPAPARPPSTIYGPQDGPGPIQQQHALAHIPPFPNPSIVQPDTAAARDAQPVDPADGEMSYFHKRRVPAGADVAHRAGEPGGQTAAIASAASTALFQAADARFSRTLPNTFASRRLLHRGLFAMACPALAWIDGVPVDEEEVRRADKYMRMMIAEAQAGRAREDEHAEQAEMTADVQELDD